MSKSLKKLIDINRLREFKNKLVGTDSAYVQTGAVDQTVAGTKAFSKPIVGSVTGSSGSCTGNAATATKATQDSAGQQINTTYIKGLAVSGRTITYTKGDGSTGTITTQDTNTWTAFKGATSSANGTAGYVPAPTKGNQDKFFKADGTWAAPPNTTYASMSASEATTGTATAARTISAKVLHDKINSLTAESILSMVYPVGSVYISVNNVSPEKFLGGTWEKISQGRVLQGAADGQAAGTAVEAGLPAAYMPAGQFESVGLASDNHTNQCTDGCFRATLRIGYTRGVDSDRNWLLGSYRYDFSDRTIIGDCYGKSDTVQPPALLVNIWKRTA